MRWLTEDMIVAVHSELIAQHGGMQGVRDEGLLYSTLVRPLLIASCANPNMFDLAAAYAVGIMRNQPFFDGNKRTGFLAAYIFLALNGWKLVAPEPEAVVVVVAGASGELEEEVFAGWLEEHTVKKN